VRPGPVLWRVVVVSHGSFMPLNLTTRFLGKRRPS
jgi:hypothetical protein